MSYELNAIVIDIGSSITKAGIAGDKHPKSTFHTIIGRPRFPSMTHDSVNNDEFIGNDAKPKRGVVTFSYPVESGIVTNWPDMVKCWKHCYYKELRMEPYEQPAHLTEVPGNTPHNREQMMYIFFEYFQVPAFYVSIQAA